ncbi:putative actinidain [Helianthus anomalus]
MAMLVVWKRSVVMRRFPTMSHSKGFSFSYSSGEKSESEIKGVFEEWAAEHRKSYKTSEEKEKRFAIFRDKFRSIQKHNFTCGRCCKRELTKFSDRTWDELDRKYIK